MPLSLSLPRRACVGAGLILSALAPIARAQQEVPAPDTTAVEIAPEIAPQTNAPDAQNVPSPPATQNAPGAAAVAVRRLLGAEERRRQTEEKLRALMVNLGVRAAPTQDAILDYLAQDEASHASLRDAEKKLLTGLRRDVPPERMRDLLADYRKSVDDDRDRRASAQRNLDARIGYSLDMKLEAVLWLMGVLGEGASKLPTGALAFNALLLPATPPGTTGNAAQTGPVYGPPFVPKTGARGEIVGTVTAKGLDDINDYWLEIRDDSGASERYAAPWREDLNAPDSEIEKQLGQTQLGARVRVQWIWQEKRRALKLQLESAPPRADDKYQVQPGARR